MEQNPRPRLLSGSAPRRRAQEGVWVAPLVKQSFSQHGGVFGECHVSVMHYTVLGRNSNDYCREAV